MVLSVNTNATALQALQHLNSTNRSLEETQTRINTGLKVGSAKDNGALFAIAQNLRADLGGLQAVQQSLDRGISTVSTALSAGEAISDLLIEMREKAAAASDEGQDAQSRQALNNEFVALRDQITSIVNNAEFNGTNMLKNSGDGVNALANSDGTAHIGVAAEDLSLTGTTITFTNTTTLGTTATAAQQALTLIDSSIANVNAALGRLGTGAKALETHKIFISKLSDQFEIGIGNLVDADLAKESARLQALQVKQQLGVQALSIANQAPQTILSLFNN
jgi:flagellin